MQARWAQVCGTDRCERTANGIPQRAPHLRASRSALATTGCALALGIAFAICSAAMPLHAAPPRPKCSDVSRNERATAAASGSLQSRATAPEAMSSALCSHAYAAGPAFTHLYCTAIRESLHVHVSSDGLVTPRARRPSSARRPAPPAGSHPARWFTIHRTSSIGDGAVSGRTVRLGHDSQGVDHVTIWRHARLEDIPHLVALVLSEGVDRQLHIGAPVLKTACRRLARCCPHPGPSADSSSTPATLAGRGACVLVV